MAHGHNFSYESLMVIQANSFPQTIGIAGCGSMGLPMAQCLVASGFQVVGHDVRPLTEFDGCGVQMTGDPGQFAEMVDTVISVVRDVQQTRDLLFGAQNIMGHANAPATVVISSTVSPRFVAELASELPSQVAIMDAPMSGAPYRARAGQLSFMLGGDASVIDPLLPVFECMASRIFRLGGLATGMTAKVLNNYCAATGLVATRRVLHLAERLELDRRDLLGVMKESSGANWFADHIDEIDWSREGYDRANTIGIVEKDVKSALDACADIEGVDPCALDEALLATLKSLGPLDLD